MKLTTQQFTAIATVRPELTTVKLDGSNDYATISGIIGKPMLQAMANKTGEAQNDIVWAFIRYISDNSSVSKEDLDALAGF